MIKTFLGYRSLWEIAKKLKICLEKKIPLLQQPVHNTEEFVGLQFLLGPKWRMFNLNDTLSQCLLKAYFMCLSACVCTCIMCALVPAETSSGSWNSRKWNCSWFQATRWVLGIRPRFSARASADSLPATPLQFLWPFFFLHVYVCVSTHVCTHAHECSCLWKHEAGIRYLLDFFLLYLFYLTWFFKLYLWEFHTTYPSFTHLPVPPDPPLNPTGPPQNKI